MVLNAFFTSMCSTTCVGLSSSCSRSEWITFSLPLDAKLSCSKPKWEFISSFMSSIAARPQMRLNASPMEMGHAAGGSPTATFLGSARVLHEHHTQRISGVNSPERKAALK